MSSTFGSLNIAKTGLQYQQVVIDTTNNNIANVTTDGYVRRRAVGAEAMAGSPSAMWSTSSGHGEGVTTQSVQRLTDVLVDARVRKEHSNLAYLQVQQTSLERVESVINEPSDTGVAHALSAFSAAWQDVASTPDSAAARQSVVAAGQTLAAAIGTQARGIDDELSEQRAAAVDDINQINTDAKQLAALNHNIFIAQSNGTDVSDLQDQRDQVALDLATKAGGVVTVDATGRYNVTVSDGTNAVDLVKGDSYGIMKAYGVDDQGNAGNPYTGDTGAVPTLQFAITAVGNPPSSSDTSVLTLNGVSGDLGGVATLVNVTLRDYRDTLDTVTSTLATMVNTQSAAGYDLSGAQGGPFFEFDPADPAGSLAVSGALAKDPAKLAASAVAPVPPATGGNYDAGNADTMTQVLTGAIGAGSTNPAAAGVVPMEPTNVRDQYQRLVTGLGATAQGVNTQAANQQMLASQVDDEHEQQAGVSLDEETINLMQAQRAYEASSRVLSVMNSILDTLINRMGV